MFLKNPHSRLYLFIPHRALDVQALLSWLVARQHAPEGGFAGRTNKLVDGCYSHWIGGCWSLIEAALNIAPHPEGLSVWNREGLLRYILCCCQAGKGGLRDKPSKSVPMLKRSRSYVSLTAYRGPDAYHTCYNLAGLSSTQHYYSYERTADAQSQPSPLRAGFNWTVSKDVFHLGDSRLITEGELESTVSSIHPVYVTAWGVAERARAHFEAHAGFRPPSSSQ